MVEKASLANATGSVRTSRVASSSRGTHQFDARSTVPAYSDVQSISWDSATREERVQEIERMHSRIDYIENQPSRESARRATQEIAVLRAYVAQLESQLYGPWIASDSDEPPPQY